MPGTGFATPLSMDPIDRNLETAYRVIVNLTTITVLVMAAILSVQFYRVYSVSKAEARRYKHYVSGTKNPEGRPPERYESWFRKPELKARKLKDAAEKAIHSSIDDIRVKAQETFFD